MLKTNGELPLDYEGFLDNCVNNVSTKDYELLKNLSLTSEANSFFKEWSSFYKSLNDELNYQRKLKLGKPANHQFLKDPQAEAIISSVMHAKNPLEAEKILLDLEFNKLDEILSLHYFDEYCLFGYAIKLKLLERVNSFKFKEGKQEFKILLSNIAEQIFRI